MEQVHLFLCVHKTLFILAIHLNNCLLKFLNGFPTSLKETKKQAVSHFSMLLRFDSRGGFLLSKKYFLAILHHIVGSFFVLHKKRKAFSTIAIMMAMAKS